MFTLSHERERERIKDEQFLRESINMYEERKKEREGDSRERDNRNLMRKRREREKVIIQ